MKDPFTDDIQPRQVQRTLLERDVQARCVAHARSLGWWARKFSSPSQRAVPDYIFGKAGCTVFVEFKAPGKQPTENQLDEHRLMHNAGLMVHVIDDVLAFKGLFIDIEKQIQRGVYLQAGHREA
jgi:hypothetical protein